MQRTCRRKIEKTTCKRRCCRGRRGVLEATGEEPRTLGPWQSCSLPRRGCCEDLFLRAPFLSSCEERGGPLPILVAVAGTSLSPCEEHPLQTEWGTGAPVLDLLRSRNLCKHPQPGTRGQILSPPCPKLLASPGRRVETSAQHLLGLPGQGVSAIISAGLLPSRIVHG